MLLTTKNEEISDIILKRNFVQVQIKNKFGLKPVPYSAIKWVSDDWFRIDKNESDYMDQLKEKIKQEREVMPRDM
jgi:hypothetical protein